MFPLKLTLTTSSGYCCPQATTCNLLELCHKRCISVPGDFVSQQSKILPTVRIFMKHVHLARTTLRAMVRKAGDHDARQTSRCVMLQENRMVVAKNLVYV
ncbi:MAG: hypothetical protein V1792_19190, partial [Pseudomonadota bacterium]